MLTDEQLKKIDPIENIKKRPSWDAYYMAIAFVVAQRSFDPSSKCGCVIISKDGRLLSTGYNGPLRHSIDEEIPLTRPDRYCYMIHGEENAILAYNGSYQDIQDSIAYVTGRPCHRCLRMLIQKGITKIIYGTNDTMVVDEKDLRAQEVMIRHQNKWRVENGKNKLEILKIEDLPQIDVLNNTVSYIQNTTSHGDKGKIVP